MNDTRSNLQAIASHLRSLRNRLTIELAARHDPQDRKDKEVQIEGVNRSIRAVDTWIEMDNADPLCDVRTTDKPDAQVRNATIQKAPDYPFYHHELRVRTDDGRVFWVPARQQ